MKKVIVAPLNWGLGHASRCVPIIRSLTKNNYTPVLAGDGKSLDLLKKEFPSLEVLELPSYHISYGKNLQWNLIKRIPKIRKAVRQEHRTLQKYLLENPDVVGLISDNRFGFYSNKVASVYMTHQVNVLSGLLTPLTSYFHQRIIKKFDACWIPDEFSGRYSGKLSSSQKKLNQKYIGILSRFEKEEVANELDILVVLSGPEPNRTLFEKKVIKKFYGSHFNVCIVKGVIEEAQKVSIYGKLTVVNFLLSDELQKKMNAAKKVICRSGYSSIMDLVALQKEAILIPTKGQSEQEYLANYLQKENQFDAVKEKDFSKKEIEVGNRYFDEIDTNLSFDAKLFGLFERK